MHQNGQRIREGARPPQTTTESLNVDGADAGESRHLIRLLDGLERDWAHVQYAQFELELPESQVIAIPVLVNVDNWRPSRESVAFCPRATDNPCASNVLRTT